MVPRPRPGGPPLMVGSQGPRVLRATLPHVDMWNAWHAWFGNTPEGLARMMEQIDSLCHEVGRDPSEVARTAAVMVQAPGGTGRLYGDSEHEGSDAISGPPAAVAEALHAFAAVGVDHVQVVVDPITLESIEWLAEALAMLDTG